MDLGGTSPGWAKVEQCMEQLSRTTQEDQVEQLSRRQSRAIFSATLFRQRFYIFEDGFCSVRWFQISL